MARLTYLKSYRKLIKARTNLIKKKQSKARLQIQSASRIYLAKKRVARRRDVVVKEREEKQLQDDVEANLDEMHKKFITDLHVMKAQTAVRTHQAKR